MIYRKSVATKVRYEKDGIYIMNGVYQTKAKITNLSEEGYLFFRAVNGHSLKNNEKIKEWLKKGFIEKVDLLKEYEMIFKNKKNDYASMPIYVTLGITSRCNYKCKHCGNNSGIEKKTDLNETEIYNLINDLQKLEILKLNFTGGEPLTNPNIFNYIRYAKEKIPRVTMTSNGSLIDYNTALKLKEAGLDMIKISIDGLENFHNQFRSNEYAYQNAIKAIRNLVDNNIEVRIQSTLVKGNQQDLIELMGILSKLGVSHQAIVPVCPLGRADKKMMLSPAEYKKFILKMAEKIISMKSDTHFQIRPVFGEKDLFKHKDLVEFETLSVKYSCEALINTYEIAPSGNVVPCSFLDISIGDIRKQSLLEIWNSEKANEIRKLFLIDNLSDECKSCHKNDICKGGCIANTYYYYKEFKQKDPYCFIEGVK
jgi:AdoMet-dependent heme synthase